MKKILLAILSITAIVNADVTNIVVDKTFLSKPIKIIDIRTPAEWAQTGIIKGAYTITFFNEKGEVNTDAFLAKLRKVVKPNERFALICRTGNRTTMVSEYLSNEKDYNVINLKGGMMKLIQDGYKPVPYRALKS
ncbi:MAG: rhodanese-like domain-containing protein [Sulfurovaceae bacterium]|nr:rhodanese-like domain-containing protein [Sulfurovaceae bacterium]